MHEEGPAYTTMLHLTNIRTEYESNSGQEAVSIIIVNLWVLFIHLFIIV